MTKTDAFRDLVTSFSLVECRFVNMVECVQFYNFFFLIVFIKGSKIVFLVLEFRIVKGQAPETD